MISQVDLNNMEDDLYFEHGIVKETEYAYAVNCGEVHLICAYYVLNTILKVAKENGIYFQTVLPWGCPP